MSHKFQYNFTFSGDGPQSLQDPKLIISIPEDILLHYIMVWGHEQVQCFRPT